MENGILPPEKYNEWSKTRIEYELENLDILLHELQLDSNGKSTDQIDKITNQINDLAKILKEKEKK